MATEYSGRFVDWEYGWRRCNGQRDLWKEVKRVGEMGRRRPRGHLSTHLEKEGMDEDG